MNLSRRSLITGIASFLAAPAIVRASSIMPVKALLEPSFSGSADFVALNTLNYRLSRWQGFIWIDDVYDDALAKARTECGLIPEGARSFLISESGERVEV